MVVVYLVLVTLLIMTGINLKKNTDKFEGEKLF